MSLSLRSHIGVDVDGTSKAMPAVASRPPTYAPRSGSGGDGMPCAKGVILFRGARQADSLTGYIGEDLVRIGWYVPE